jgi:hypothetical protein
MALLYRLSPTLNANAVAIQIAGQSGLSLPISFATSQDAGTLCGAITVQTGDGSSYGGTITLGGTNASSFY